MPMNSIQVSGVIVLSVLKVLSILSTSGNEHVTGDCLNDFQFFTVDATWWEDGLTEFIETLFDSRANLNSNQIK